MAHQKMSFQAFVLIVVVVVFCMNMTSLWSLSWSYHSRNTNRGVPFFQPTVTKQSSSWSLLSRRHDLLRTVFRRDYDSAIFNELLQFHNHYYVFCLFQTSQSNGPSSCPAEQVPSDNHYHCNPDDYDDTDSEADSQFGTKQYWDEMYLGMGDFDSEEYCWYYGFDAIQPYFLQFMPLPPKHQSSSSSSSSSASSLLPCATKMLVPGVGNDGTLLDLYKFGYHDIVAFDYSAPAIDRQREFLSFHKNACNDITLLVRDARKLDSEWTEMFDIIFEKGALDAIFLSGSGNVQLAAQELKRVLKPGGYMMSISGVVPEDMRRALFPIQDWEWVRDGAMDLKAGCFVWKKKDKQA
mmetsp:Transcript_384/g.640  ORF Transcript_384/g.640 Transcript_384/m.640 type:complete len:351 (-) Transcript_384:62-1114(-)